MQTIHLQPIPCARDRAHRWIQLNIADAFNCTIRDVLVADDRDAETIVVQCGPLALVHTCTSEDDHYSFVVFEPDVILPVGIIEFCLEPYAGLN